MGTAGWLFSFEPAGRRPLYQQQMVDEWLRQMHAQWNQQEQQQHLVFNNYPQEMDWESTTPNQTSSTRVMTVPEWRACTDACFANYSTMECFPYPPRSACTKQCAKQWKECNCYILAAVQAIPNLNLRKERVRWHPDRFEQCRDDKKEEFKSAAEKIFVVLSDMIEAAESS